MKNERGLIIVYSGPAGSGKGTVRRFIEAKQHFEYSVSATTRDLRPGEVEGVDYNVYTKEQFEAAIENGEMLEHACYCQNYYGTPKTPVLECVESGRDIILEIEVDGAMQVKKKYPESVLIMLLPPSYEKQRERLVGRNTEPPEVIEKRLAAARREIEFVGEYDYVIYNKDGEEEKAADDFLAIIRAEKCRLKHRGAVKDKYFGNNT